MSGKGMKQIALLDIIEIPRTYIESTTANIPQPHQDSLFTQRLTKYERLLGAIMHSGLTFGFRMMNTITSSQLSYTTHMNSTYLDIVKSAFMSQFPNFPVVEIPEPRPIQIEGQLHTAIFQGVPKKTVLSLNELAYIMKQSDNSSLYQVWATSKKPGRISKKLAKSRYKSSLEKSQQQDTEETWLGGRTTRTRINPDAQRSSKRLETLYRRMNAGRVLDCRVILAFWGNERSKDNLLSAVNALLASISPDDKDEMLKYKIYSGNKAYRIMSEAESLSDKTKGTEMLPSEAVPLFEIPSIDLGLRQGSQASFASATYTPSQLRADSDFYSGYVALGHIFRQGILDSSRPKLFSLEYLRRHVAILGMTGTGKTTTKNRIVIDAWKNGVPSLLIEPVKTDVRELMGAIPSLKIFTVGLEQVTPFRLNPFYVEEGVHVQLHISLLVSCFMAAWPVYGILANHLRRVIIQTYTNNDWDLVKNKRGRTVMLEDFKREAERYGKHLAYGSELKQDFLGALLARVEDLCDPSRAAIFNTTSDIPIEELLAHPTVLELRHIAEPDFRSFILSLILIRVYEHFHKLGTADKLRNLLVIDEAHSVLEELPKSVDMNESSASRRQAVDQLCNIIAESRSLGLGVIIADQNPMRLSRDALKTCHTKIVHTLTSHDDRKLLALETGCSPEQERHIDVLKVGEVIMRGPGEAVPTNLQIIYDPEQYPEMKRRWTDDDVRKRMTEFYKEHPEFAKTPSAPVSGSIDTKDDRESITLAVKVEDLVRSIGYRDNYLQCINDPRAEIHHSVEEIFAYYATRLTHDNKTALKAVHLFEELSSKIHRPPPYVPDWSVIERLIETSLYSGVDDYDIQGE